MKKAFVSLVLVACLLMSTVAYATDVLLYALDGRTIAVNENEVEAYTAEGMGWFLNKPVEMYALDGRTIMVPQESVEAYKSVGWFLKDETPAPAPSPEPTPVPETPAQPVEKRVAVKYTDSTVVSVPEIHVEMYKALGWVVADEVEVKAETVVMYNPDGVEKEIDVKDVAKYEQAGWVKTKPVVKKMMVYSYDGQSKEIPEKEYKTYEAQGWYHAYDAAVYSYAVFGLNGEKGAQALMGEKKYEEAFLKVQAAIEKIEETNSEYVPMLHYMRSLLMNDWQKAEDAPIAMIEYEFTEKSGNKLVILDYRNISNNRIQSFKVNFDICAADGTVIETNSVSYSAKNLEMKPFEKKRCAWKVENCDPTNIIKNLHVIEVVFSDETKWAK
ncbi:MAG: hypothetical protein IKA17_00140 [Clostridia bacterium]|nr:hypothetical protein [Clostridia bacterium]